MTDPRAEFMARLDAHEDLIAQLHATAGAPGTDRSKLLEAFRMSRRAVVAAYDQASLHATPIATPIATPEHA